ncbi:hypothetical protein [Paenibacillus sp. BC26]|uniref:hypothetical protein n=1 Tax=Paenibacillus sp. BC26 TaxID=1881032 RepID=UPI001160198D|nr:hypothetical protein [Paenibacillus sp. BC26]
MVLLQLFTNESFAMSNIENTTTINSQSNIVDGEITVKQAVRIGVMKAKEWDDKASLALVTSVDENLGGSRGFTGRRYNWNLIFINHDYTESLILSISKGHITNFVPIKGRNDYDFINTEDVKVDSPTLVEIAKTKYKLKPGTEWATGYHFTLSNIDHLPCLRVVGLDRQGRFTKLYFNVRDGQELFN